MRLILSRKGFDTSAGGCPSPIFPDESMIALPIPEEQSPRRYGDLTWRGRNLGDVVEKLTGKEGARDRGAHLDPDLRRDVCRREGDWRPAFGQDGPAQGHLRKQGVGRGDLFLFWGSFQRVDGVERDRRAEHYVWGWLQIGCVASVDAVVRRGGEKWRWAQSHPHCSYSSNPTNTLYVAADRLSLPGVDLTSVPGSGVFDFRDAARRLTCETATNASEWSLPSGFLPGDRPPLTYHGRKVRWSRAGDRVHLRTVGRGQEFVLDLELYPELIGWLAAMLATSNVEASRHR